MTSKSARRVCVLRYLVSSCAIGYTNRIFAVAAVLKSGFLLSHPLLLQYHVVPLIVIGDYILTLIRDRVIDSFILYWYVSKAVDVKPHRA